MARLRTFSRWIVLALVALVVALILLHQLLAGGQTPSHTPAPLPTALAPRPASMLAQRMDERSIAVLSVLRA